MPIKAVLALIVATSPVAACGNSDDTAQTDTVDAADTGAMPDSITDDTGQAVDSSAAPDGDVTALPAGAMIRYTVRDATGRDALCNDGTPAIYYHRYGSGPNKAKWIIYFKGGGGCFSPSECDDRWMGNEDLMSSAHSRWGEVKSWGGMLSGDESVNPDFHDWSVAYLVYCSSDGWAGDKAGGNMVGEWHFRGSAIAQSVVNDLRDPSIMTDGTVAEADAVIVTGSSAGASGVRAHIDWIADALAESGVDDVKGLHDAGWYPDVYPEADLPTIRQSLIDGILYTGAVLDSDCVAQTAQADAWRCIDAYHVAPFIDTPLFVYMDQYDPVDMGRVFLDKNDATDKETFREGVRELMMAKGDGCFSPAVGSHEAMYNDDHWDGDALHRIDSAGGPQKYRDVFANWYFGRNGPTCAVGAPQ